MSLHMPSASEEGLYLPPNLGDLSPININIAAAAAVDQEGGSHEECDLVPVLVVARAIDAIVVVLLVPVIVRGGVGVGSQP